MLLHTCDASCKPIQQKNLCFNEKELGKKTCYTRKISSNLLESFFAFCHGKPTLGLLPNSTYSWIALFGAWRFGDQGCIQIRTSCLLQLWALHLDTFDFWLGCFLHLLWTVGNSTTRPTWYQYSGSLQQGRYNPKFMDKRLHRHGIANWKYMHTSVWYIDMYVICDYMQVVTHACIVDGSTSYMSSGKWHMHG